VATLAPFDPSTPSTRPQVCRPPALPGTGLLTEVELLASGELFATSVLATDELPQADSARAMIVVPSGVASNASLPVVRDAFSMP
jgi:hypothetical protein